MRNCRGDTKVREVEEGEEEEEEGRRKGGIYAVCIDFTVLTEVIPVYAFCFPISVKK